MYSDSKDIWDLTVDEVEYVYKELHMNNYVYAAVMSFYRSKPPLNKIIDIKEQSIPRCLHEPVRKLIRLSPYLGREDTKNVRTHYTYNAFELFQQLRHIKMQEVEQVIECLAALAYIPIIAEKNDGLSVWLNPVIRKATPFISRRFEVLLEDFNIDDFVKLPVVEKGGIVEEELSPTDTLFEFTPRVTSCIITMIENGIDLKLAEKAYRNAERHMIEYEQKHNLGHQAHFNWNIKMPSQTRYRNSFYLYGGTLLEKMGNTEEAFAWYCRDLLYVDIFNSFGFYLTSLKTSERLLCAYRIMGNNYDRILFKDLIKQCIKKSFINASEYADVVLDYIRSNPDTDLSQQRFILKNNKYMLYGGEPSREIFLIALLYNNIILNVDYQDIDYNKYLEFD